MTSHLTPDEVVAQLGIALEPVQPTESSLPRLRRNITRRRRLRSAGAVLAAVLVIAGGAAGYASLVHDDNQSLKVPITTSGSPEPSPSASPSAPPTATQRIVYQPFAEGQLRAGLTISTSDTAMCPYGLRYASDAAVSYRCFADNSNSILQPCFADPSGMATFLACPVGGPLATQVVALHVAAPPTPYEPSETGWRNGPWAIEVGGDICVLVDAALDGQGPYFCKKGTSHAEVDTSGPWWWVDYNGAPNNVTRAWF